MNEATQNSSMEPIDFVVPSPNKNADAIGVIGFGTAMCEAVKDPKSKDACRRLVEPLEKGEKDPIDVLMDLLIQNPADVDEATDRFNYNMQEAMKRAEAKMKAANGT